MICVKNEMPSASGTSVVLSGTLCSTLTKAEEYSGGDYVTKCSSIKSTTNIKIPHRVSSANNNNNCQKEIGPVVEKKQSLYRAVSSSTSSAAVSLSPTRSGHQNLEKISSKEKKSFGSAISSRSNKAIVDQEIFGRGRHEQQDSVASSSIGDDSCGLSDTEVPSSSETIEESSCDLRVVQIPTATDTFRQPGSPSSFGDSSSTVDSTVSDELKEEVGVTGIQDSIIVDDDYVCDEDDNDDDDQEDSSFILNSESSARTLGFSLDDLKKWKIQNERSTSSLSGVSTTFCGVEKSKKEETMTGSKNSEDGQEKFAQLDEPKIILFDREKVTPGWKNKMPIGCGLINLGNSCYLNATLQTLFHTPAFINWLLDDEEHRKHCQRNSQSLHQCVICPMANTAFEAYSRNNQSIRPILIHEKLKIIGKTLTSGRQEDAHEFMRLLLESMEDSYLTAVNGHKLDSRSKETTPLGQIFGGYYRDEVTCLKCQFVSTTFHPQAELQLDIRNVSSIEDGIALHFKRESLENNDYRCEKCSTIEPATKQHFLEMAPIVLCVQLKRFRQHGTKITKPIHINRTLNLKRYIHTKSPDRDSDASYRLVGLISHIGTSPNCGHYTAIAEAQNGMFYHFDDSCVRVTNLSCNQNSDAYVVIYEMNQNPVFPPDKAEKVASAENNTSTVQEEASSKSFVPPLEFQPAKAQKEISKAPGTLPSLFTSTESEKPWGVALSTPLYGMTVDEIIDKWCTRTQNNCDPSSSSIKNDFPSKDVPLSMDLNRNQVVNNRDRKRFSSSLSAELHHDSDDDDPTGVASKEKKGKFLSESSEPTSSAVTEGASGDEDDESQDLTK